MQSKKLKEIVRQHVRLKPPPIYRDINGERHVISDWFVERLTENGNLFLNCSAYGFELQPDQLHQYNVRRPGHDGILTLTGQFYIEGVNITFEPVIGTPGTGLPLRN